MLDVNWLTPAKRRQLVVVGEEGMFELDYLTQRLTFTRATDTTNPRLIGGYAPTFEGEVAELPVASAEPLAAELDAFLGIVRERRPAGRRRRGRPVGRRRRHVPARVGRERQRRSTSPRCPRGSPSHDDRRSRPTVGPEPARRLDRAAGPRLRPRPGGRGRARGSGAPGTAGRVAVVGAGKMGLPLAAQFADHGWRVIAVDVQQAVVDAINEGRSHVEEEPGLAELGPRGPRRGPPPGHDRRRGRRPRGRRRRAHRAGHARRRAAARLSLHGRGRRRRSAPGVHAGLARDLRDDAARRRHAGTVHAAARGRVRARRPTTDFFVAFSPERLYSGAALRNLATYPKLVGGIGPASTARAAAFYDAVLDAEIVAMSNAEAAEFSKLADTTYRDVNIALANEFARYAERVGVDIHEVIAAANSQPYSPHPPARPRRRRALHPGLSALPAVARARSWSSSSCPARTNDGQIGVAIRALQQELGGLEGVPILVLGLTYRHGVKELAYSRALPLIERLDPPGRGRLGLRPAARAPRRPSAAARRRTAGASAGPFRAIVTQTADPLFATLDPGLFPDLAVVFDGRDSLREPGPARQRRLSRDRRARAGRAPRRPTAPS